MAAAGGDSISKGEGTMATAEPPYETARTSVWWDIENCLVPKGLNPHTIGQAVRSALLKVNYCVPLSIYAYGDTNGIPSAVQKALNSTGIGLNHVPSGAKDASDKKILVDMLFWAVDNPAPANIMLISGDGDFSNALHQLRMRGYNILLAQPQQASTALIHAATTVWKWASIAAGGLPLTCGEISQLASGRYGSLPKVSCPPAVAPAQFSQQMDSNAPTVTVGDDKCKGIHKLEAPSQANVSRDSTMTVPVQEDYQKGQIGQQGDEHGPEASNQSSVSTVSAKQISIQENNDKVQSALPEGKRKRRKKPSNQPSVSQASTVPLPVQEKNQKGQSGQPENAKGNQSKKAQSCNPENAKEKQCNKGQSGQLENEKEKQCKKGQYGQSEHAKGKQPTKGQSSQPENANGKQSKKGQSGQPENVNAKQSKKGQSSQPENVKGKQSKKGEPEQQENGKGKQSKKGQSGQSENAKGKQAKMGEPEQPENAKGKQSEKGQSGQLEMQKGSNPRRGNLAN